MKYFIDMKLVPETGISLGFLWQKVYQQIHIALAENKVGDNESDIALSIPDYGKGKFKLGSKIRLLAETEEKLIQLDLEKWLSRFRDYVVICSIKEVPSNVSEYATFKRKHKKGEKRLADSKAEKQTYLKAKFGESFLEKSTEEVSQVKRKEPNFPFIWMQSTSTSDDDESKHRFPLFITMTKVKRESKGKINCYGLSSGEDETKTTVPWF